ncbi:MAG: hypothetical protein KGL75_12240 [Acidobacteriota bacterium]|nr:hypothetical protein [Acidobacteriota bacterium]
MATSKPKKSRRGRRRKRWPLDEALRRQGLDEVGYAENLDGFFRQLQGKADVPKLKLLLDGLKELARHLEGKTAGSGFAEDGAPVTVQLVHNVDRPARSEPREERERASGAEPE